jgi:hypothetical protein
MLTVPSRPGRARRLPDGTGCRGQHQQQKCDHDRDDRSHQQSLDDCPFAAVGEEERVPEDDRRNEVEDDPQHRRDDPDRAVDAVLPRLLAF